MITTDDDAVADRCRIMSLHGISRDAWKRYTAEGSWRYEILAPGFKYNLTDIAAALGLVQLGKLDAMWRRRRRDRRALRPRVRRPPRAPAPGARARPTSTPGTSTCCASTTTG